MQQQTIDTEIERRLMAAHIELMPAAIFGNLINVALLVFAFAETIRLSFLATIAVVISTPVLGLLHFLPLRRRTAYSPRALQTRAMAFALVISTAWALSILTLASLSAIPHIVMLGMLTAGMMAGATLTCSTVPKAAYAFLAPLALATVAGFGWKAWQGETAFGIVCGLALSFTGVLIRSIQIGYHNHIERLRSAVLLEQHSREAEETAATIKLLLNDFEEQGSDWLWEIDDQGCVLNASSRFAEAARRSVDALNGSPLSALFAQCPERDDLLVRFAERNAFRDLVLPVMIDAEERWWSLTGRASVGIDGSQRFRGVATDVTNARQAEARVSYLAHYDALTDLPNRLLFNESLARNLHRNRDKGSVAVLAIDLDNFKNINDTLGHSVGDTLLQCIGRRLEGCARDNHMVARVSGDEFAVMVPAVRDRRSVQRLATRMMEAVAKPIKVNGNTITISASIGIALAPTENISVHDVMKHVDLALYCAKSEGRGRLAFFEPHMDEAAQARRMVETELRAAITENQLSIYYQPLVETETGHTVGYEALVRWKHPTRGLILPGEFIPIAEETGMIVQLGEWVIRNATADAATWPDHLTVAVNLSPLQMKSKGLANTIISALAHSELSPARLELEITEGVLMNETEANLAILHNLRSLGVRIALDDFGTGYSSLNYLRAFPFDKIKIDRCFVEHVDHNSDCQAIIRAITSLASSLGMVTTAEGVEHPAQLEQLRKEGCTTVQGYMFSKARPLEELDHWDGHSVAKRLATQFSANLNLPDQPMVAEDTQRRIKVA